MSCIALYDENSHLRAFDAQVVACTPARGGWAIALDQTAFFPEGGGTPADTGTLRDAAGAAEVRVTDVQECSGEILHFAGAPLTPGSRVHGEIDWARRFRHMQNHSGEHIVSGLIHTHYGLENVGFHLGAEDVTIDLNGELTRAQLDHIEDLANDAVFRNLPVRTEYPAPEALVAMFYRSKRALAGRVRIVTIGDVDCCACCAPHVAQTGEIGAIKLLDFVRMRGGVRVHLRCGADAMADYREKYRNTAEISALLSAKQNETAQAVQRLWDALQNEKREAALLRRTLAEARAAALPSGEAPLCLFESGDRDTLRMLVNAGVARGARVCGVFCGSDASGYRYVLGSRRLDLRAAAPAFNARLHGRGGGSPEMIQGSVAAPRDEIQRVFSSFFAQI